MATPIGTNVVNSLARRHIMPVITDNIYKSNVLLFRLYRANKKLVQGGFQIEAPLMYASMAAGGPYQGLDLLDVSPTDSIKNGAWDWKQQYVPVSVDGLTLIKTDQPEAIANFLTQYFEQAQMQLSDNLGTGIFSDLTNSKQIDGIKGAIDDGTTTGAGTYGGLTRSSSVNTWWRSQMDTSTALASLTMALMQTLFGSCTEGARHPTLIVTTQAVYNKYYGLQTALQAFPSQPEGHDEQLAQAGFSNLLFNGVPMVVDSHVPAGHMFFLNEDYFYFVVSPRADFYLEDFIIPVNQDALVAKILWAGNLIITNVARQGKFTALT